MTTHRPVSPRVRRVLLVRRWRGRDLTIETRLSPVIQAVLALLAVVGVIVALAALDASRRYQNLTRNLPPAQALLRWLDPAEGLFALPTRLEDRLGHTLWGEILPEPARQARYIPWRDLGRPMQQALLGVLDPDLEPREPPPDPAQDLALDFLLAHEPPGSQRDWRARLLAQEMRRVYPHERLLEWWANTRSFGPGLYGVDAAAWAYFDRPIQELTWSQTLWIAVAARWPQVMASPQGSWAKERYRALVNLLHRQGALSRADLVEVLEPPTVNRIPPLHPDPWRAWWMQSWLRVGSAPFPARGRVVRTTVDADLQTAVACLVAAAQGRTSQGTCPAHLPPWPHDPLPKTVALEAVVLDPATGEVLALIFPESQNRPQARPLGTGLAPWLYAAAFTRGWTLATLLWDLPTTVPPPWEGLTNHDGAFHGPLQAGRALANTYEVPLALLLERFDPTTLHPTLTALGVALPQEALSGDLIHQGPMLTLPQVAHRLGLFATLGTWAGWQRPDHTLEPVLFVGARTLDGAVEPLPPRVRETRLSPGVAYLVAYALSHPAWRTQSLPQTFVQSPPAFYIGRSQQGKVLWLLGFSPQRVVGLVLDARERSVDPKALEGPARTLWMQLFQEAHRHIPPQEWNRPQDVVSVSVCVPSGLLPSRYCPTVEDVPFLPNTQPTQVDTYYRPFYINSQSQRLATVFTPPEWVEERVYFVYPPEARSWAEETGKPLPPTEYDPLPPLAPPTHARLTHPPAFGYVRGEVPLRGTAAGPEFRFYRVQVGAGPYPRQWQTVVEKDTPVVQGVLGTWDTRPLPSGLYSLQLNVVDTAGRIATHTVQVTVDNRAPHLEVLAPAPQGVYPSGEPGVFILAQAHDDYHLAWVRFLVDGREVVRFRHGPFRWISPLPPGKHVLEVIAQDGAGNETRVQVPFTVLDPDG